MEPRKYSTGTKGRIKMHSDKCKEFIQANSPSFSLANEFIESIDPDREETLWQRFQNPEDILPELQAWLGGDEKPTAPPPSAPAAATILPQKIRPASQLVSPGSLREKADSALQKTRAWINDPNTQNQFNTLTPTAAAESAIQKFYRELTGTDSNTPPPINLKNTYLIP